MGARGNRTLYYAVLASLALHLLVLFIAFPELIESARRAVGLPPLVARLAEPAPEQPAPAPEPVAKKPPRLAKPAPGPPVVAAPQIKPEKSAPQATAAPSVAAGEAQPAPPAPSTEVIEAQSADRYRMELIAALTRMIKDSYPPQARENNWEGDVLLGVVIRGNGTVSVAVKRSSQFGTLDQRAVELLTQATREVPVPPALRGKESVLKDLLVQYRLRD